MGSMSLVSRRAFFLGGGVVLGCQRASTTKAAPLRPTASAAGPSATAGDAGHPGDAGDAGDIDRTRASYTLFAAFPRLGESLARIELGRFPSSVERAASDPRLWIKRDDDFTRSASWDPSFDLARLYGGGKIRKLELYLGEARALGKRRIVTSGGVGSNQAVAVALVARTLGLRAAIHLAPMPASSLTAKNLGAAAAADVEMRLFGTVTEAHAEAVRDAQARGDTYVVPPGGTTPLGTLGFVNAGLELAEDVREGRLPRPHRVYVALGLGGSAAGLGIGFALGGLRTEIVAVRASSPASVTARTLRAIHRETIAFARARDPSLAAVTFEEANVRIDDRFVGAGYGIPTTAGNAAIDRARVDGLALEPVYTGKAFAALLDDASRGHSSPPPDAPPQTAPLLFWNTMSSRPVARAAVPPGFERYAR
jgi:D-cysteine desulfhydrase